MKYVQLTKSYKLPLEYYIHHFIDTVESGDNKLSSKLAAILIEKNIIKPEEIGINPNMIIEDENNDIGF